jgi:mono/diheme cytochrome c family protein
MWLLTACVVVHLPDPSDALVAAAQVEAPHATLDSLRQGRDLLLEHCAGCHRVTAPRQTLTEDWPEAFDVMIGKAKITTEEADAIEVYLRASARVEPEK